jgi:hypothetical protein
MLGDMLEYEFPEVTAVRHVKEHVLWLRFSDGIEGEVDLSDGLRGPIFEPLRDPARFADSTASSFACSPTNTPRRISMRRTASTTSA